MSFLSLKHQSLILFLLFITSAFRSGLENNVPFSEYGDVFVEEAGHPKLVRDDKAFETVFNDSYVAVKLGVFDVWYPRLLLRESKLAKQFKSISETLLDVQDKWVELLLYYDIKINDTDDLDTLRKWVKTWKLNNLPRRKINDEMGRPDLLVLLKAKEPIIQASNDFENFMVTAPFINHELKSKNNICIIFAPTRKNFMELTGFLGSLSESNKAFLWHDDVSTWTEYISDNRYIIALEYAINNPGNVDITKGDDIDLKDKTALLQHVVMDLAVPLSNYYQTGNSHPGVIEGLAFNMVIDMFKKITIRPNSTYDSCRMPAFYSFISKNNADDGMLKSRKITGNESRWKCNAGRDYFISELKNAQKQGAKEAKKNKLPNYNKSAFFILQSITGTLDLVIRAPFLMVSNDWNPISFEYVLDFQEFQRAYQCAFIYWIRNEIDIVKNDLSPDDLAKRVLQEGSIESFKNVYGIPLTSEDPAVDSLEWRFLEWLSK